MGLSGSIRRSFKSCIMVNDFFEKVYVINLDSRPDRLAIADCFLKEQGIKYERFPAIKDDNGIKGLILTMIKLFRHCMDAGYKNVLVLEDDVQFLVPNVNAFLNEVLPQLPTDYLTFHLGLNLLTTPTRISQNILRVNQSYSTHAIAYSREAMVIVLNELQQKELLPYDIYMRDNIQIHGRSYCTMPMIATQRPDYSDIEKRDIDWAGLMSMTFNMHTKKLQSMNEIAYCIGSHKLNGREITVDPTIHEMQHPELIGQICDCKKFRYDEEMCGCTIKEWRVTWKENTNN